MKLRQRPEDFVVEEATRLEASRDGPYGLYELRKRGLTTPAAVSRLARAGGIDPGRIRYCGMKDRHAVATQTLTIFGKPVRGLRGPGFRLTPLGRSARAAGPSEIVANRFTITIRDLSRDEAERAGERAAAYARTGFPDYFDEQRFGSARATGEFPGEAAAAGDYEKALRLVIAKCSREDPPEVKKRRRAIDAKWGEWRRIKREIDRSSERSIVTYLVDHPRDFAGAFDRLKESLRSMVLSAFQSLVWNEMLSGVVRARFTPVGERPAVGGTARTWVHKGRYDEVVFFEPSLPAGRAEPGEANGSTAETAEAEEGGLDLRGDDPSARFDPLSAPSACSAVKQSLRGLEIPFPHRSLKMKRLREIDLDAAKALEAALERRGLTLDSFRLRGLRKAYFWRGERKALAEVGEFSAEGPVSDEMNRDRFALTLAFSLPPGAYATMFVKAAAGPAGEGGNATPR